MEYKLAVDLVTWLKKMCPVDSGALKANIMKAQGNEKEWIIIIGTYGGSEMNGGTPTIEYAAKTNFAEYIDVFDKGPWKSRKQPNFKRIKNPNYHWVNHAIETWAKKHINQLGNLDIAEDDILLEGEE